MSKILNDFSEKTIINAIEANMYASTPFPYDWPGAETYAGKDISWCVTDIPAPTSNVIFRPRLKKGNAERVINKIKTKGNEKKVPLLCWIGHNSSPVNLCDILLANDFFHLGDSAGMAIDLHAINGNGAMLPTLTITEIYDEENIKKWCTVSSKGFGFPMHVEPALFIWAMHFIKLQIPVKFYLAKLGDEPVSGSMCVFAEGVAGLYYIATVPEARCRGIGHAITHKTLSDARKMGYRIGILQASKMGEPVYSKIGFKKYSTISSYVWLDDVHRNILNS